MPVKVPLTIGTRIVWEYEIHKVTAFVGGDIELVSERGKVTRIDAYTLQASHTFSIPVDLNKPDPIPPTYPDLVPEEKLKDARKRLAHLNEVYTGFSDGNPALARPGEPRAEYDPDTTTLAQRYQAKADEMGITVRMLQNYNTAYKNRGLMGLVDKRSVRDLCKYDVIDRRIKEEINIVLEHITNRSNISKDQINFLVDRELKKKYPDEKIPLPSKPTFNRLVKYLARGRGTFGPAKERRNISNRPATPYMHFYASRPGEIVLIDSTPWNVFALDLESGLKVRVHFTLAMDLYSRSLPAWRLTPVAEKGVDASLVLFDMIRPKPMRKGWPMEARWPHVGVPEQVVIELLNGEADENGVASTPPIYPATIVTDRGKIFISEAFMSACARLGISLVLARPYAPTDKSHIERMFRTIRQKFEEYLRGYKGPDVYSRGKDPEGEALWTLDELEELFAFWVATVWQPRYHDGLNVPMAPLFNISPNNMISEGIARSGFIYVVPDPSLYYDLLPTCWVTIQHYGVRVRNLFYDGAILNEFRDTESKFSGNHAGEWPIRYDPRDRNEVYFYDYTLGQWHALEWIGKRGEGRPFNDITLNWVKAEMRLRGGNPNDHDEMERAMNMFLDRVQGHELDRIKEQKVAVRQALTASQAKKDRLKTTSPLSGNALRGPDDPANLDFAGTLSGSYTVPPVTSEPESGDQGEVEVYRTIDEEMDDDDFKF